MVKMPEAEETTSIRADDWELGEAVVVRTYLGSAARRRIQDATMQFTEDPRTGKPNVAQINTAGATALKLQAGIGSWSLVYPSGKPVPCTVEMMEALPDADADFILSELTRLWSAWGRPSVKVDAPLTEEAAAKKRRRPFALLLFGMLDGRITEPEPGQEKDFAWVRERLRERYVVKNYNVGGVWGYRQTPAEVVDFWLSY